MAFTYGFYNSINGDRKYDAKQISAMLDGVITDGVFDSIGELLATVPGEGLQVLVKPGRAWFNGTWSNNDSTLPLTLSLPDVTRDRIDAVVLEINESEEVRKNSIRIVQGTATTTPERPVLINDNLVHQYALAYVTVPGGASSIATENIEIMVGQTPCPFVTSVLESVPIDDLFSKWEGEFTVWFDNLKAQLTDNVVTNLQRQIDENKSEIERVDSVKLEASDVSTQIINEGLTMVTGTAGYTSQGWITISRSDLKVIDAIIGTGPIEQYNAESTSRIASKAVVVIIFSQAYSTSATITGSYGWGGIGYANGGTKLYSVQRKEGNIVEMNVGSTALTPFEYIAFGRRS